MVRKRKAHPKDRLLLAFCEGEAACEEIALIEVHLSGCARCRRWCEEVRSGVEAMRSLPPVRLGEREAQEIQDELQARIALLAVETKRWQSHSALARFCLNRSHAVRYQDPKEMLRWARMARVLAGRCDAAAAGGEVALADLRARAWGQFGNALRVAGRLREAAAALDRSANLSAQGSGDLSFRAQLLSWTASLRIFERRFDDAIALFDEAARIARALGTRSELALYLSNRALATVYSGHPEAAIGILNEALQLIDRSDQRLLLVIHHNLIHCFIEAGRLQEAQALFPQTRSVGEAIGDELVGLRLLWQEARILRELGMLEEAEAQFSRVREGFLERDLYYEAAVVSLDLTAVYVKLGLHTEVRRTIGEILPIFSSLRVGRELLASLIQLQQAEDQTQALQLIRVLSRELVAGPKLPPSV